MDKTFYKAAHMKKYVTAISLLLSIANETLAQYEDDFIRGVLQAPALPTVESFTPDRMYRIANPEKTPSAYDRQRQQNEQLIRESLGQSYRYAAPYELNYLIRFGFPSHAAQKGTQHYYSAFTELLQMLQDSIPLSLERAVFVVENAYYGNTLDYAAYQKEIRRSALFCYRKMSEEHLKVDDNTAKNMILFRYITDTLHIKKTGKELEFTTHYPIKYNYDDFKSEKHYDSHFVTQLMRTHKGQCHSMPLYYMILAEKMETQAFLAYAPYHSFVKIKDDRGVWYNLELTNGAVLSDAHYMNNSYIKVEALRNRLYLEPTSKKETVARLMLQLANGYNAKFGYDHFTFRCADSASPYLQNQLPVLWLKARYQQRLTMAIAQYLNAPRPEIMKQKSPQAYKHYEKWLQLDAQITDMGYEDVPQAVYTRWMDYVETQKEKQVQIK